MDTALVTTRPQNIVLVTLDTTRADRLGLYGDASATTPVLDRLAREGVVFDRVESVAPLTLPAHCSLFTGLYPRITVSATTETSRWTRVTGSSPRGFGLAAFCTVAFVGSTVLAANRGLARGFDVYSDGRRPDRKAPHRRPANQ